MKILAILVFCLLGFFIFFIYVVPSQQEQSEQYVEPVVADITVGPAQVQPEADPYVLAFIPYWEQERAFQSLQKHADYIDTVSLFWYVLEKDGSILPYEATREDMDILDFARERGVSVLATIANLPDTPSSDWDGEMVGAIVRNPDRRADHIENILKLVEEKNFDGVTIDYEALLAKDTQYFSVFIAELAERLHQENKILHVSVYYKDSSQSADGYNWEELAQSADHIGIMAYGEHWEDDEPGPIASVPWVTKTLQYARSIHVPMEKMYLGLPAYGYDWQERPDGSFGRAKALVHAAVKKIATERETSAVVYEPAGSAATGYYHQGARHVVWFEDAVTIQEKIELAKSWGVGGVFLWHLGGEDELLWKYFEE